MKISIVIPNYNGKKFLEPCLHSLMNQSCKDYEIIIVDNASSDESLQYIEENWSDIKLIKNSSNTGFSYAVNQGIEAAQGEFVVLLNNDTIAEENWLENLLIAIEKDSKIFSVCSKMIRYNERDLIDNAGDFYTILGWARKRGDGKSVDEFTEDAKVFSSCAGAAIYRKSIFKIIGDFDINFFAYLEDIDICYRANLFGYKNIYCASAKIYHIGSATSGSRHNKFKVELSARNNIYVIYKNMSKLQLFINSPILLVGFLIKYVYFLFKGLGKEYIKGVASGIKTAKVLKIDFKKDIKGYSYLKQEVNLLMNLFRCWYN